jgi:glucoamylase
MENEQITGEAFGRPGIAPKWTSSTKEAVGTACSRSSRIWFTVSHGIVNEIYYPTIDHPQTRDLELLITDGETFFHEEKRDLRGDIRCVKGAALGYCLHSTAPEGLYRIHKDIICAPHDPCLLIHTKIDAPPDLLSRLKVYVLLAPHLGIGGAGNSARKHRVAGSDVLVAWKGDTFLALGAQPGFLRSSCGFAGHSDGWQDLHENFQMDWSFYEALDGNIAVMGQVDLSEDSQFTLAVSFGDALHAAVTSLKQVLSEPFSSHSDMFVQQWQRSGKEILPLGRHATDGGRLYPISHSVLVSHEDKTYPGAFIASASIPWGESKGDEDLGGYHLVWTRDMVNTVSALLACGDTPTPCRALVYLACSQRPDGGFPQNFWIDGSPYWGGIQLDEVAFPVILAWRLWKADALGLFDPYHMIMRAAHFMIREGPATQQERWEENSGYSPSTLASNVTALICAADFARARGREETAVFLEEYADFLESHIISWTVTSRGTLVPGIPRHFIRILPTDIDDPSPLEDPDAAFITLANRPPGSEHRFPAKEVVDAGFLELVRYGILKPGDPLVEDSLKVIDAVLKVETPFGPCWRRYNHDGYGQGVDGEAYMGHGKGRAWPLLTGERGHYEFAAGRDPRPFLKAIEGFASPGGMLPEQVWDEPDRDHMKFGRPTGSAMPLCWAHAEYIKLLRSVHDGRVFDRIPIVADRYQQSLGRKDLEVWKPVRQLRTIQPGKVLRVQNPRPFTMTWTDDEWQTTHHSESSPSGIGIGFVDIPVKADRKAPIRFTFFRPDTSAWEGRDYQVETG